MNNTNRVPLSILMGTSFAAFGIGYIVAPTEQLDTEVTESGFASTTTTQVLSATVESLRKENKLQVFTYKGAAKVSTCRNSTVETAVMNDDQTLLRAVPLSDFTRICL